MTEQAMTDITYPIAVTSAERSALIWALEVSRALLVADPNLHVLLADDAMTPQLLDDLADRLVSTREEQDAGAAKPSS